MLSILWCSADGQGVCVPPVELNTMFPHGLYAAWHVVVCLSLSVDLAIWVATKTTGSLWQ